MFGGSLPAEPLWLNRTTGLSLTFVRAVDVPFAVCSLGLQAWWERAAVGASLRLGRGRLSGPPDPLRGARVVLYPGLGCPSTAMTLDLQPWFATFGTKLVLQPTRVVRGSRRYFRAGHDFLDRLIDGLTADWQQNVSL